MGRGKPAGGAVGGGESPPLPTPDGAILKARDALASSKLRSVTAARGLKSAMQPWGVDPAVIARKLLGCSSAVVLREWIDQDKVTLRFANFCNLRGLCSCCDRARALALVRRFVPVLQAQQQAGHQLYMLTLTVAPSPEEVNFRAEGSATGLQPPAEASAFHLECVFLRLQADAIQEAWRRMWAVRKQNGNGPLRDVLGAVISLEVPEFKASWHCHAHALLVLPRGRRVDADEFRADWCKRTGSHIFRLQYVPDAWGALEVFKYAVKPPKGVEAPESLARRFMAHWAFALEKTRLVRSYGVLHGIGNEPMSYADLSELGGAWRDWLLNYSFTDDNYWVKGIRTDANRP